MDRAELDSQLETIYQAPTEKRRVVVRQACDLAASGHFGASHDADLSVSTVLTSLEQAPADMDIIERWNWWIGALELAHGAYDRYRIRRYSA